MNDSDIAMEEARKLRDEYEAELAEMPEGERADLEGHRVMMRDGKGLLSKLRFEWRPDDQATLEQIRRSMTALYEEMFSDVFEVIDGLYAGMRVPVTDSAGAALSEGGRIQFQKDERGNYVERWDRLTDDEIEDAIFRLGELRLTLAPRVNSLLMEALFAKYRAQDEWDDTYTAILEDTVPGRTAKANKKSRNDRYHALYLNWAYTSAESFFREVVAFQRTLDNMRYRGVGSNRRA